VNTINGDSCLDAPRLLSCVHPPDSEFLVEALKAFASIYDEQHTLPSSDAIQQVILFSIGVLETTAAYSGNSWSSTNTQADKSPKIMIYSKCRAIFQDFERREVGSQVTG
jgi:hypothetical protein